MNGGPQRPRYLVFAGENYSELGGWDDFVGAYLFLDDATARAAEKMGDHPDLRWAQVVDLDTMERVATTERFA